MRLCRHKPQADVHQRMGRLSVNILNDLEYGMVHAATHFSVIGKRRLLEGDFGLQPTPIKILQICGVYTVSARNRLHLTVLREQADR